MEGALTKGVRRGFEEVFELEDPEEEDVLSFPGRFVALAMVDICVEVLSGPCHLCVIDPYSGRFVVSRCPVDNTASATPYILYFISMVHHRE